MNISEFFSYKTFYYFLKDISFLDLSCHKLIREKEEGEPFTTKDLEGAFEDGRLGTKDIILIKTKYGYFCYHDIDDMEYVKKFIATNSRVAPCGVFGSYRTSGVYLMGIAKDGVVQRFLYGEDGNEPLIEGERTQFEIENNLSVDMEDFESQLKFFNEENVFSYAKWFAGFDIENEDVEVLDILYYHYTAFSNVVQGDMVKRVYESFKQNNVLDMAVMIGYDKSTKEVVIACENPDDDGNRNTIYCDKLFSLDDKQEFIYSLKRCYNALYSLSYNQSSATFYNMSAYYSMLKNNNCNIACYIIDTERKFMNSLSLFQKKGKICKQNFFTMLRYGKIYYQLNDFVLNDIYTRVRKILK